MERRHGDADPGWDPVVRQHRQHRPAALWPRADHVHHANIAPIWPKEWADAPGYASPASHMDTYLQWLGEGLGRHDKVPIEIVHDRPGVTGSHDDQTYAEGRQPLRERRPPGKRGKR